ARRRRQCPPQQHPQAMGLLQTFGTFGSLRPAGPDKGTRHLAKSAREPTTAKGGRM
ncbi:MAG: hypothetical protein AVDCRST_MAG59-1947, partial [uncultured Thermomicrobiales bacterium]